MVRKIMAFFTDHFACLVVIGAITTLIWILNQFSTWSEAEREDRWERDYGVACDVVTDANWHHPNLTQAENRPGTHHNTWAEESVRERCKWTLSEAHFGDRRVIEKVVPCVHGGVAKGCAIYKDGTPIKMRIVDPLDTMHGTSYLIIYTEEDMERIRPYLTILE